MVTGVHGSCLYCVGRLAVGHFVLSECYMQSGLSADVLVHVFHLYLCVSPYNAMEKAVTSSYQLLCPGIIL